MRLLFVGLSGGNSSVFSLRRHIAVHHLSLVTVWKKNCAFVQL